MKKITLFLGILVAFTQMLYAGGLQHNTNQSAAWIRTMVRDASTSIDAAYFNPAGLTHLADGIHFQVNSQTIMQNRTVTNDFAGFHSAEFDGETMVPALPTFFAAYKSGKFAVSAGFIVVGGGGGAAFDAGVPQFEYMAAMAPAKINAGLMELNNALVDGGNNVNLLLDNDYEVDMSFTKSQAFFGVQMAASYAINDMISLAAGGRYVFAPTSMNYTEGYIRNLMVVKDGNPVKAGDYLMGVAGQVDGISTQLATAAAGATGFAAAMSNASSQGYGDAAYTAVLDDAQTAQANAIMTAAGVTDFTGLTVNMVAGIMTNAAPVFQANSDALAVAADKVEVSADEAALETADKEVYIEETGSAFTPIVGANFNLLDGALNIGLKYEFATTYELTTSIIDNKDGGGLFVEETYNSDLPALLSVGANYKVMDNLGIQVGYHYYFDKSVKFYDSEKTNDEFLNANSWELAVGLEYGISDKLLVSAGYLRSVNDKKAMYQTDLSNSIPSTSFGGGLNFALNEAVSFDLGVLYTMYDDLTVTREATSYTPGSNEIYYKDNLVIAVGVNFALLK